MESQETHPVCKVKPRLGVAEAAAVADLLKGVGILPDHRCLFLPLTNSKSHPATSQQQEAGSYGEAINILYLKNTLFLKVPYLPPAFLKVSTLSS